VKQDASLSPSRVMKSIVSSRHAVNFASYKYTFHLYGMYIYLSRLPSISHVDVPGFPSPQGNNSGMKRSSSCLVYSRSICTSNIILYVYSSLLHLKTATTLADSV